jgi:hypothetical protein
MVRRGSRDANSKSHCHRHYNERRAPPQKATIVIRVAFSHLQVVVYGLQAHDICLSFPLLSNDNGNQVTGSNSMVSKTSSAVATTPQTSAFRYDGQCAIDTRVD